MGGSGVGESFLVQGKIGTSVLLDRDHGVYLLGAARSIRCVFQATTRCEGDARWRPW